MSNAAVNIDVMMDVLDIDDLDAIQEQHVKKLRIGAKRRWHSDTIHHKNPTDEQLKEYNHKFNLIDECVELLTAYINGEVHFGAFTNVETGEIEITEELKSKVKDMASDLKEKWNYIKKNGIDLVKETVLVRAPRPFKEFWSEWRDAQGTDGIDGGVFLQAAIVGALMNYIYLWCWLLSFVFVSMSSGFAGTELAEPLFLALLFGGTFFILIKPVGYLMMSLIVSIPAWRLFMPSFIINLHDKLWNSFFVQKGRALWLHKVFKAWYAFRYETLGKSASASDRKFYADINLEDKEVESVGAHPVFIFAVNIIRLPLKIISAVLVMIPFFGNRMVGERRATKKYFSGYADWYINELLDKDIESMDSDDLQAVTRLYNNYKEVQVKKGKSETGEPDYSEESRELSKKVESSHAKKEAGAWKKKAVFVTAVIGSVFYYQYVQGVARDKAQEAAAQLVYEAKHAARAQEARDYLVPILTGSWRGHYICSQGKTKLHLVTKANPSGEMTAIFKFKSGSVSGSYNMEGSFNGDGSFSLRGTKWIKQPRGYAFAGLNGSLSGNELTGEIPLEGCSSFTVKRIK